MSKDLAHLDKTHLWHPFTQMQDWCASPDDPLVIESGLGATLTDTDGNTYLDGNSSIWTNIHGHRHPTIDAAIRDQLEKIAHCSALGFSNEPAIQLAEKLVSFFPAKSLTRVFFTDDGSTAIECACKMAVQYRQLCGEDERTDFISFDGAYHGDTVGAASLGGIATFKDPAGSVGYPVQHLSKIEDLTNVDGAKVNAVIIEPLIQGAAGIQLWPDGMLRQLREWCDHHGVFLILDEVMTGFGRTGKLFACQHEDVVPDFLCLAKGLTGGYMPLAATLTTERVFSAFLGRYDELKTFFYGHSYCANPLGCAAALGSLRVFEEEAVLDTLPERIARIETALKAFADSSPHIGGVRQLGMIAGLDLINADNGDPLDWRLETGARICKQARQYGLLTRPVRDTLTLMLPLCATAEQWEEAVDALAKATADILD